jgi:hypothetical protein
MAGYCHAAPVSGAVAVARISTVRLLLLDVTSANSRSASNLIKYPQKTNMQPRKSTKQSAAKMLKQTTLLGGKTRPASPSTSKPRPMRMEVVICRPAWTLRVPQSKPDDVLPQPAKKPPPPSAKRTDKEKGAPACRKRKSRSVADSDPAPPTRKRKTLKKAASRVLSDNSGDEVDSEREYVRYCLKGLF